MHLFLNDAYLVTEGWIKLPECFTRPAHRRCWEETSRNVSGLSTLTSF